MAMKCEKNTEIGPRAELVTKTPSLIQRCILSDDGTTLTYDYMGSSEFEFGDQSKSLKRIFEKGIAEYYVSVEVSDSEHYTFYLTAAEDFDFENYAEVIKGFVTGEVRTKEPVYVKETLARFFGQTQEEEIYYNPNSWFDFTNDVIFTHDPAVSLKMKSALEKIKTVWETPEPEYLTAFKAERALVEEELRKSGYLDWFYLGDFMENGGKYYAWLNTDRDLAGWYTLDELRAWNGQGKIREPKPRKKKK